MAVAFAGVAQVVNASDWQWTTESDSANYFMDFDSIATQAGHKKAWVRVNYTTPMESVSYPKKPYKSAKLLYYFDCSGKLLGIFQTVRYADFNAAGEVVETDSARFSPTQLNDVVPDTIGEKLQQIACSPSARASLRATNEAYLKVLQKSIDEDIRKAKTQDASSYTRISD